MARPDNARLLELPVELVEWIAQDLSTSDLMSTRLACRELEAKVSTVFAKKCFVDRAFFVNDRTSMLVLVQIAQHPLYAKTMKRVRFNVARLLDSKNDHARRVSVKEQGGENRSSRARNRECRQQYEQLAQDERRFRKDSQYSLLSAVLSSFVVVRNTPAIAIGAHNLDGPTGTHGVQRLRREIGYRSCFAFPSTVKKPFENLWVAMMEAEYPITNLTLGNCTFGTYKNRDVPVPLSALSQGKTKGSFRHLTSLKLTLPPSHVEGGLEVLDRIDNELVGVLNLLTEAAHLQKLNLVVPISKNEPHKRCDPLTLAAIIRSKVARKPEHLQHIRELTLAGHSLPFRWVVDFVREHRVTLRKLVLHEVIEDNRVPRDAEKRLRAASGREDFVVTMYRAFAGWW
ncbi:hypothetical protein LTR36_008327 [Oleoguttula mirabilis]|uniref:F-box domain-containing protein n=1 Tax=Oleoguttula mirabilis TaxID=1507867 RepID=A0AAV9J8E4_9PEZI|nr:hypothetical protein LTR36_008327 [Oleoguttula mirabilis]